jgi:TonB family protein
MVLPQRPSLQFVDLEEDSSMPRLSLFLAGFSLFLFLPPLPMCGQEVIPSSILEVHYPYNSVAVGVVSVVGLLNASGEIEESRMVNGVPSLNQESLRSVLRWKFAPLTGPEWKTPFPISVNFIFGRSGITRALEKPPMAPIGPYLPPVPVVFSSAETSMAGEGFVVIQVSIDPQGSVTRSKIIKYCQACPGLDEACLKAAGKWKFEPGRKAGQPVSSTAYIGFVYKALPANP